MYVEEAAVGAGNYGRVSVVRHQGTGALHCMKSVDWTNKTEKQVQDSFNEVKVMAALRHPNIIDFIEAFEEQTVLHIVMEYADAMDLERYLLDKRRRESPVSEGTIMRIFLQICLGLRYLHKEHLLHRDLKSANVFLTRSGGVKLGDFGFAKQLNCTIALASTVCGTPYYFSPELCAKMPYSTKADVWSLGVTLFEMINLRKPFEAKTLPELRKKVIHDAPARFVARHVSRDMEALCLALLSKDQDCRPSIEEVLRMPYVQQYLSAFAASMDERARVIAGRKAEIFTAYPCDDKSAGSVVLQANVSQKKQKFDPRQVREVMKGKVLDIGVKEDKTAIKRFHQRDLPDVRGMVGKACPLPLINELYSLLLEEESCAQMKADASDILTSRPSPVPQLADLLGAPQTDEENYLRCALGEGFVKAVELSLKLNEASEEDAPRVLQALTVLLGDKDHLLSTIQRVAMQFELDK